MVAEWTHHFNQKLADMQEANAARPLAGTIGQVEAMQRGEASQLP